MLEALTQLRTITGECVDASAWSLSDDALVRSLDEVQRAEQVLAAVKLRLIRQVHDRDLPIAQHASSAAVWLRERYRISIRAAKRLTELARYLDEHPGLAAALATGEVNVEQAEVIAATITDLPADVGVAVKSKAEAELITQASDWEPAVLRQLGGRILDYVAPEVAEAADAKALRRHEARAQQTRAFHLTGTGDGRVQPALTTPRT